MTAADFKKYPDGVLDRVITDHLTNCEVCGELPYARTEPDKKQKAMPLGESQAGRDTLPQETTSDRQQRSQ